MALFEKIRSQTDSTAARVFFILIVLVFVFWGVGAANGPKAQTYASVNGVRITDSEVNQLASQMANRGGNQMNSDEEEKIRRAALDELILTESLYQEALKMGLEVSDDEMAFILSKDELFIDNGEFSWDLFEEDIKRRRFASKGKFNESLRRAIALDKLMQIASKSIYVSDASLKRQFNHDYALLKMSWVVVPESALLDDVVVSDEEIQAEIDANLDTLTETYERLKKSKYVFPDRIKYEIASIDVNADTPGTSEAVAKELFDKLTNDKSIDFEATAKSLSMTYTGATELRSQNQLEANIPAESETAKSLFALSNGGVLGPKKEENTWYIYKVTEKSAAHTIEFEQAKKELAKSSLQEKGVTEKTKSFVDGVLANWKEKGEIDTDKLIEQGLEIEVAGPFPRANSAQALVKLGNSPLLLEEINGITKAGVLAEPYPTIGGFILAKIDSIEKPKLKFNKVKSNLVAGESIKFLKHYVDSIKDATEIDNRLATQNK